MSALFLSILLGLPGDFEARPLDEAAPEAVSGEVRNVLTRAGTQVLRGGKPFFDFWMRRTIRTGKDAGEKRAAFGVIPMGSFVGVARIHARGSDFRKNAYGAGVYTMRYLIQPEDGDHDGTAPTRDFLILSPASMDRSIAVLPEKAILKMSEKVTGKKHPAVLYLVRVSGDGGFPRVAEKGDFRIFACRVPRSPGDKEFFRMGIVVVGTSPEF